MAEERARHPEATVEVWAFDEHRAGLKPVPRRVWAKRGRRPVATVEPRYEWLCLYGFVRPTTGALVWFPCNTVNAALLSAVLARFAAEVGAGPGKKRVILMLDGAGWHATERLTVPAGLRLEFLLPYSPELQPAERLWTLTNESIANRHFASFGDLDRALAERCLALCDRPGRLRLDQPLADSFSARSISRRQSARASLPSAATLARCSAASASVRVSRASAEARAGHDILHLMAPVDTQQHSGPCSC